MTLEVKEDVAVVTARKQAESVAEDRVLGGSTSSNAGGYVGFARDADLERRLAHETAEVLVVQFGHGSLRVDEFDHRSNAVRFERSPFGTPDVRDVDQRVVSHATALTAPSLNSQ